MTNDQIMNEVNERINSRYEQFKRGMLKAAEVYHYACGALDVLYGTNLITETQFLHTKFEIADRLYA